MKALAPILSIGAGLLGFVLVLAVILWDNPYDWFVSKSSSFDRATFVALEPGAEIDEAVHKLGPPIRINKAAGERECEGCFVYVFMGDAPGWVVGHRKAWLVVDSDGTIVSKILIKEP